MSKRKKGSRGSNKSLVVEEVQSPHKVTEKYSLGGIIVSAKNEGQKNAIQCIKDHEISVIYGYPGSGKSHLAVGLGLQALMTDKCEKLIFTRPYVEAGEHLGFLPGSLNSKIAPFMYPIMEIAGQFIGTEVITAFLDKGNIQVIPMAYMRGITFHNSFVVMDEAQNATPSQMRMILTRIGEKSKLVITGDTEQSDLKFNPEKNGLVDAISKLTNISEIGFCELDENSCVRSPLVAKIDKIYRNSK